ncbi:uncharacterized protein AB675_12018 [Cyphellophora attinorum]|uniref:Uncharacterized protein n=1 Tax=Cyphellophora attinorum TaxID=1664694 RepID=A0A0N1H770_9EURO|nr:uncharacterized protein AB675_12018 [Phialophora attinorum]KPI38420.1 hypothetical protein AB675_12018 [Phialophora attinorum]
MGPQQFASATTQRRWSTEAPPRFTFPTTQVVGSPVDSTSLYPSHTHDRVGSMSAVYPSPAPDGSMYAQPATNASMYTEGNAYARPQPLSIPIPQSSISTSAPFTPFDTVFNQKQNAILAQLDQSLGNSQEYSGTSYTTSHRLQHAASTVDQVGTLGSLPEPALDYDGDEDIEELQRPGLNQVMGTQDSTLNYGLGLQFPMALTSPYHDIGSTPRLKYLINYYAEVISPVIVAFDSSSNPFRTHVLHLATESDALQHAIGALAASNLRQRKMTGVLSTCKTDPARRSSIAHLNLSTADESLLWDLQQAMHEETRLKNHAVALLNQQLSHPGMRLQDSALAVLLILCLFHMCDTGVAKFSTQFQGVKKLLALRKTSGIADTEEARFCRKMFAWWDGVTSSVNEREALFSRSLQSPPTSPTDIFNSELDSDDGSTSFEMLAGIDTGLFRIVSRLGRLNMLAQGSNVEKGEDIVARPPTTMGQLTSQQAFGQVFSDDNSWLPFPPPHLQNPQYPMTDARSELFHRELSETLHLLSHWTPSPHPTPNLTPSQQADLHNLSLTFYHATHLYLVRLQQPNLPSASPQIHSIVQAALSEMEKVKADVYLLWPLFIAGSECVGEMERARIRRRVAEIQGDSGFVNNGVAVGILERVWATMDGEGELGVVKQEVSNGSGVNTTPCGFRWSRTMKDAVGAGTGEYIVV